jgi:catechol 2,3-dioxygenase-like lactoylglutathione lyase family enzyme
MAKLRHISLHTPDPEKTAEFYKRVFDMVEVGRTDSPFAEGIFLSDGTVNLSVVRFKTKEAADRGDGLGSTFGLHHFGFWVENEGETRRKLKEAGADGLEQNRYRQRIRDILNFLGLTWRFRPMHTRAEHSVNPEIELNSPSI